MLGYGIGLRPEHFARVLEQGARGVDWLEVVSENFFEAGGRPWAALRRARADVPVCVHGVSMCIGSRDPLRADYLAELAGLAERLEPAQVSDHLSWGSAAGAFAHDLLPLPFTEEALAHVATRVAQAQDTLGRRLVLENVSSYVEFSASAMPEWVFVNELARRTGCGVLFDVNNALVCAKNHGFEPESFIDGLELEHVTQVHVAGHTDHGDFYVDTHVGPVPERVWALYERFVARAGREVATLVEWDTDTPSFEAVAAQADEARRRARRALGLP